MPRRSFLVSEIPEPSLGDLPYYSVKDFSAIGDGITDDTAAIQAALTAAVAGTTVLFPTGTYLITDSLTLSTGSIQIQGEGQDSNAAIHFNAAASKPILKLTTGSTRLVNIMLRGDGTSTGGGIDATNTAILATDPTNLATADFDLYCDRVTFSRLAIGIDYRGRNLKVNDSYFSHVKDSVLCTGATSPSGGNRGYEIINSRFHSCGSTHLTATRSRCIVFPAAAQNVFECKIQNNYVDDCEQFIVGFCRSGIISGNEITRVSTNIEPIDISTDNSGSAQGMAITGNHIARATGDTTAWTSQHGIKVGGNYVDITSNVIIRMGGNGIQCAASNCGIFNNIIVNPSYGTPAGGLAAILVSSINNNIVNNYCLLDDATNSGMTYGVDCGANSNYVGTNLVIGAVTSPFNGSSLQAVQVNAAVQVANAAGSSYLQFIHNGTNGIATTSGGVFGFGTQTTSAGLFGGGITGYISIVDSGGTPRKLAVVT